MINMSVSSRRSSPPTAEKLSCIVCCASAQENWHGLLADLDEKSRQWYFCHDQPQNWLEKLLPLSHLSVIRASWQAVQLVQQHQADLLVTGDATFTFWCALFAPWQNIKTYHVAASFHLPRLPEGVSYLVAQWAYSRVSRLFVHSRTERQLYGNYFGIPATRFEMHHWTGAAPTMPFLKTLERGEYICAISEPSQDDRTLMAAIATLPNIPLILMVPRGRAIAAKIPPNVTLRVGLSSAQQLNVLRHARFLVAPIRHSCLPSPHATFTTAMRLGKTFVTTDLPNVSDYAFHHANAVLCPPANPEVLATAIEDLWSNVVRCEILGRNGKEFAEAFCSDDAMRHCMRQLLIRRGL